MARDAVPKTSGAAVSPSRCRMKTARAYAIARFRADTALAICVFTAGMQRK